MLQEAFQKKVRTGDLIRSEEFLREDLQRANWSLKTKYCVPSDVSRDNGLVTHSLLVHQVLVNQICRFGKSTLAAGYQWYTAPTAKTVSLIQNIGTRCDNL